MATTIQNEITEKWRHASMSSIVSAGILDYGKSGGAIRKAVARHGKKGFQPIRKRQRPNEFTNSLTELKRHLMGQQLRSFLEEEQVTVDLLEQNVDDMVASDELPEFIVFTTVADNDRPEQFFEDLKPIVERMVSSDYNCYLVIAFAEASPLSLLLTAKLFARYPALKGRVEIAHQMENLENELNEAFAKAVGDWHYTPPTLLEDAKQRLRGVLDLYSDDRPGRLCASKVSKVFGFKQKVFAGILTELCGTEVSPPALSATPDAERLQNGLRHFERIARLRTVMTEDEFNAWLGTENWSLEDVSPMQCIMEGDADVVAGLASRIIGGNPS